MDLRFVLSHATRDLYFFPAQMSDEAFNNFIQEQKDKTQAVAEKMKPQVLVLNDLKRHERVLELENFIGKRVTADHYFNGAHSVLNFERCP